MAGKGKEVDALKGLVKPLFSDAVESGGETEVDLTVRVFGTLSRGADYERVAAQAIKPEKLVALLLAFSGATREVFADLAALGPAEVEKRLDTLDKERIDEAKEILGNFKSHVRRHYEGSFDYSDLAFEYVESGSEEAVA